MTRTTDYRAPAFAKRLQAAMDAAGITSGADLARQMFGDDYHRHAPSAWLRGACLPTRVNLARLARTLGVAETDLLPDDAHHARAIVGIDGRSRLEIDIVTDPDTAAKVMALLSAANN